MDPDKPAFWFPAKRYGIGWSLPVRWQGWLVLAIYFAAVLSAIGYFHPRHNIAGFMICLIVLTFILVTVIASKGEKPMRWRWGR